MKKFVCIVLALALALSLCTVAFAKTTTTKALDEAKAELATAEGNQTKAEGALADLLGYVAHKGYGPYQNVDGYQNGNSWWTWVSETDYNEDVVEATKALDEAKAAVKTAEDKVAAAQKELDDLTSVDTIPEKKTEDVRDKGYALMWDKDHDGYLDDELAAGVAIASYEASKTTENDKFVSGKIAYKVLDGKMFVEIDDAADAEAVLYKDGKFVSYVVLIDFYEYTKTGAEFENYGDTCGMYKEDAGVTYYAVDGKTGLYVEAEDGDTFVLVGYEVLKLKKADKDVVPHDYRADTTVTKVGGVEKLTVTKVYCTKCNKEFAFKTSYAEAIKAFGTGNFKSLDIKVGTLTKTVYVELEAAQVATNNTKTVTTVDSSKTFDAGVATYAVLSLASVAGSAVVIGKKKEF